ncbi:hypothetical protein Taro_012074 [Colocasia esculenta]|uniref:Uncharacterized protein n=1 Tax=Colocasia esculenta TaxID=4460 RepID=A0A843UEK6_COLES|nr:hypothetical protein [Colocasia esculenta]
MGSALRGKRSSAKSTFRGVVGEREREMGWKRRSSSSSAKSLFSMFFKHSAPGPQTETVVEQPRHRARVYISDEDRGRWVADPDIDRRAEEFIKNFKDRL